MTRKQRAYMNDRILKHGNHLKTIFPNCKLEPVALCKKVHKLEIEANQLATDYCNGVVDCAVWETKTKIMLRVLVNMLGPTKNGTGMSLFINGDCRGYALKLEDDTSRDLTIYKDWGGYGIIAPDFKEEALHWA